MALQENCVRKLLIFCKGKMKFQEQVLIMIIVTTIRHVQVQELFIAKCSSSIIT